METKHLQLKIVTPEKVIFDHEVENVHLPTTEGEIVIYPDHMPIVATLTAGDLIGVVGGEAFPFAIVGGFVEFRENNLHVLADFAEHVSMLTDEEVEKAKNRARELEEDRTNNKVTDLEHFEVELERALTRVKIADKWKGKKYR